MTEAIGTDGLTKTYGPHRGVADLDLVVHTGEVFGYLGPNGAGKTTTIRLLLDLVRPTAGTIEVLGLDSRRDSLAIRRRIGYVPGELALYERMTGRQLVEYFGALRGGVDPAEVTRLAERLQLDLDRPIRSLSKGNKQKVGLVQAFAPRPELLILDEPTSGLDPLMQHEFLGLVDETRADGRTVLLSSHDLPEVQRIADRVGIIRAGRLVAVDTVEALQAKALRRIAARFADPVPAEAELTAEFGAVPGVTSVSVAGGTLRCAVAGSVDPLIKALARHEVVDLSSDEADLDELFLAYYGDQEADRVPT